MPHFIDLALFVVLGLVLWHHLLHPPVLRLLARTVRPRPVPTPDPAAEIPRVTVVGPRPERPVFVGRLEDDIPFYVERTYGLRPGITGLAQVNQGYDATVEDVRSKVLHDHAYAVLIRTPGSWLKTDLGIIAKTFTVMVLGKGQ